MKAIYVASLTLVSLMGGVANAADLFQDEPVAAVYTSSAFDWSGFYVGVNGGYAGNNFTHPFLVEDGGSGTDLIDGSLDISAGGFVGGVQAGANMQMDGFVIGVEGDVQGSTVDGRISVGGTDLVGIIGAPGDTLDADAGTKLDYFGTLRARGGVTFDRALIYGTGGLAYGRTSSSVGLDINGTSVFEASSEDDRWGYAVGTGIEYALTDNLTFKTEYLYTDLGSAELLSEDLFGTTITLDSEVAFHAVRAGVNFQF